MFPFFQSLFFSSSTGNGIEINKEIDADFIKSNKKVVLLFFGYVGCQDVCTPVLQKLSDIYESEEFKPLKKNIEIVFVNLTPEAEEFQADLFAKFFNKNFRGVYLSKKSIFNIDRNFALYFSRGLADITQLNHTDYIYLIQNSLNSNILKKMYSVHPINRQNLINDITDLTKR